MLFDMVCSCGAAIQISHDEDNIGNAVWLLINRFVNAHVKCGFATPLQDDAAHPSRSFNMDMND